MVGFLVQCGISEGNDTDGSVTNEPSASRHAVEADATKYILGHSFSNAIQASWHTARRLGGRACVEARRVVVKSWGRRLSSEWGSPGSCWGGLRVRSGESGLYFVVAVQTVLV